jgi:hypothetical protein
MKPGNSRQATRLLMLLFVIPQTWTYAQTIPDPDNQLYLIHTRGMLHETVFNTGEIGQPTQINQTVLDIVNPMMEWPPYLKPAIPTSSGTGYSTYPGQHNGYGSGVYISANYKGSKGLIAIGGTPNPSPNRVAALCGGVTGSANRSYLQWSWPVKGSFKRTENYPVLSDGSLNPAFNPNEAEEIITAKWNTNAGISVTRTSRAYSYPDYDDFIIYEYEFENNGIFFDVNTSQLVRKDTTLVDVYISFMHAISPSAFGEIRHYDNSTKWVPHVTGKYTTSFWDPDYGLLYNQVATGADSLITAGFPEKDATNFLDWSRTGKYGGGLLSPQAAGFSVMYYDTAHLAYIDTLDGPNNQSPQYVAIRNSLQNTLKNADLDQNGKIKQPYNYYTSNASVATSKAISNANDFSTRMGKNNNYYAGPNMPTYNRKSAKFLDLPAIYSGRAIPLDDDYPFNANYPVRYASYGLYYLKPGDKIRFTTAEMVGFGADTSKLVIGGLNSPASGESSSPYHPGSFWNRPVVIGGKTVTQNYVADFGIPDYVNSKVVFINDVAHKAYEAYVGHPLIRPSDPAWDKNNPPTWPEKMPNRGSYSVPIPIPAPAIETVNTDSATVTIKWKRDVESFEIKYASYVTGKLSKFIVYRAEARSGPWKKIGTVVRGQVNSDLYRFDDLDRSFLVGESRYYAVTSIDGSGNESGKTNVVLHDKKIGPVSKLGKIHVVPNPYNATTGAGFSREGLDQTLGIYGLPATCTIHFYSFAGQKLWTIEHNEQSFSRNFELITRNFQEYASGVYFYVVLTPEGERYMGKFVVVK